jgi:hypothetical protein
MQGACISRKWESSHIFLFLYQDNRAASFLRPLNSASGAHGASVSVHEGKELYGDHSFYSLVSRHYHGRRQRRGRKVGICGQAPSDYPEFARFLVTCGIDSISLNPDTVLKTTQDIVVLEHQRAAQGKTAAEAYQRRSADNGRLAKELQAWWTMLQTHWHEVRFGAVEMSRQDDGWSFRVRVYLGEIPAASVRVELYADPTDGEAPLRTEMGRGDIIPGAINGYVYHACIPTARPAADFTPRVVPYHPEARVPTEAPLIRWQR